MADKKERVLVPSEKAFALLARLVKHTEPGGAFYCDGQPSAVREDFMAEVEGLLMSRASDAGATPPEILVMGYGYALREIRAILFEANHKITPHLVDMAVQDLVGKAAAEAAKAGLTTTLSLIKRFSDVVQALSHGVADSGKECDEYMHMLGIPPDVARTKPTQAEVDAAYVGIGDGWCNCKKCREGRASDAVAEIKNGGVKSQ